jgi:hypothetical protein
MDKKKTNRANSAGGKMWRKTIFLALAALLLAPQPARAADGLTYPGAVR